MPNAYMIECSACGRENHKNSRNCSLCLMPLVPSGIEALVCADIAKRQQFGIKKYGITVADNPLELLQWLQHAYEESMDQTVYLRRTIEEVKAKFNLPGAQNGTQTD